MPDWSIETDFYIVPINRCQCEHKEDLVVCFFVISHFIGRNTIEFNSLSTALLVTRESYSVTYEMSFNIEMQMFRGTWVPTLMLL